MQRHWHYLSSCTTIKSEVLYSMAYYSLLNYTNWIYGNLQQFHNTLQHIAGKTYTRNVGKLNLDTVGDVFVGVRAKDHNSYPFRGFLAGVTLMPWAVPLNQLVTFRRTIMINVLRKYSIHINIIRASRRIQYRIRLQSVCQIIR